MLTVVQPKRHRTHVAATAHVELILGNDELMFKQVAACTARAFSPKFVARLAETFTRHAREIAEGLQDPPARRDRKKKKQTGRREQKKK